MINVATRSGRTTAGNCVHMTEKVTVHASVAAISMARTNARLRCPLRQESHATAITTPPRICSPRAKSGKSTFSTWNCTVEITTETIVRHTPTNPNSATRRWTSRTSPVDSSPLVVVSLIGDGAYVRSLPDDAVAAGAVARAVHLQLEHVIGRAALDRGFRR